MFGFTLRKWGLALGWPPSIKSLVNPIVHVRPRLKETAFKKSAFWCFINYIRDGLKVGRFLSHYQLFISLLCCPVCRFRCLILKSATPLVSVITSEWPTFLYIYNKKLQWMKVIQCSRLHEAIRNLKQTRTATPTSGSKKNIRNPRILLSISLLWLSCMFLFSLKFRWLQRLLLNETMDISSWNVDHGLKTAWKWSSWSLIWEQGSIQ